MRAARGGNDDMVAAEDAAAGLAFSGFIGGILLIGAIACAGGCS